MLLFIDSTDHEKATLALIGKQVVIHQFEAHDLSEKLLPEIKKFFKKQKIDSANLKKIAVVTGPGGFSKVRTGVAVANALAFGLKIPLIGLNKNDVPADLAKIQSLSGQKMVEPYYDREPNITLSKKK